MRGLARAAEGALGLDEQKGRGVRAQRLLLARILSRVHHAYFEAFVGLDATTRTQWDADNFVCRTIPGEHGSEKDACHAARCSYRLSLHRPAVLHRLRNLCGQKSLRRVCVRPPIVEFFRILPEICLLAQILLSAQRATRPKLGRRLVVKFLYVARIVWREHAAPCGRI
jgi:hypothetical protein